jgi:hypothetical protein
LPDQRSLGFRVQDLGFMVAGSAQFRV